MTGAVGLDCIRAFSLAAQTVLQEVLEQVPALGTPKFHLSGPIPLQPINVSIGITGAIAGVVNFGMDLKTACAIASIMSFEEVPEFDEMAQSALCELANMIAGNARTHLLAAGVDSNITPPSLLAGDGITVRWSHVRAAISPITLECGSLALTVGIRLGGED